MASPVNKRVRVAPLPLSRDLGARGRDGPKHPHQSSTRATRTEDMSVTASPNGER